MIKYNREYAKPDANGYPLYAPIPLVLHIPHHDEWDEDVIDPETGEPTGETEHKERDWIEDKYVQRPEAADWAQAGYLKLYDTNPGLHEQGKHWQKTGKIVITIDYYIWEYVLVDDPPPPPRVFSKLYLELALFKAGLLDAVDAFIDSQKIIDKDTGKEMPLRRAYSTALTFAEDNEYFAPFLAAVKSTLGIDDVTAESILSASVEGGA